jgi:hypothetical protein
MAGDVAIAIRAVGESGRDFFDGDRRASFPDDALVGQTL